MCSRIGGLEGGAGGGLCNWIGGLGGGAGEGCVSALVGKEEVLERFV